MLYVSKASENATGSGVGWDRNGICFDHFELLLTTGRPILTKQIFVPEDVFEKVYESSDSVYLIFIIE